MMIPKTFNALVSSGDAKGNNSLKVESRNINDLPQNEVLIQVKYSSLNYKDALSSKGHTGITRNYPHVPGIDASGIVLEDKSGRFKIGDEVLVTGYDLGMNTSGGFGRMISVPADWVHRVPSGLSLRETMILGTAGFTAALALYKCEHQVLLASNGPVLVTGATGGVGSLACLILVKAGYTVTASTGKKELESWLKELGVQEVIPRSDLDQKQSKPLLKSEFAGCIDTVGGITLQNALKRMQKEAPIAVCGNVSGNEIQTTVFPFILRGNALLGIDTAHIGFEMREQVWRKLAKSWKPDFSNYKIKEVTLEELPQEIEQILAGKQIGKVLVKHD